VQGVKDFGLNMVRLHQKVNPERWYYHADRLGVVVLQDMVQKYGGATNATVEPFLLELRRMIDGRCMFPQLDRR
jgi:beta-galactosidase/beta-glucuronidase